MQFINEEIERRIVAYQNSPCDENEKLAFEVVKFLSEKMLSHYAAKMDLTHIFCDDVTCYAMERIWHFDPVKGKGKVFNYFTSVILCFLRSLRRRESKYAALREKYQKHLHPQEDPNVHVREAFQPV